MRIENCAAVILCGGESRRMGRDKATAPFRGKPLWRHVHEAIAPLFSRVYFSVHAPRADLPGPQVVDNGAGRGPMLGIASALAAAGGDEWIFAIACDMPFVTSDLVRYMAGRRETHDAVVAKIGGNIQPLPGFYAQTASPMMREAIENGNRSVTQLLTHKLEATILSEPCVRQLDPDLCCFMDFDSHPTE